MSEADFVKNAEGQAESTPLHTNTLQKPCLLHDHLFSCMFIKRIVVLLEGIFLALLNPICQSWKRTDQPACCRIRKPEGKWLCQGHVMVGARLWVSGQFSFHQASLLPREQSERFHFPTDTYLLATAVYLVLTRPWGRNRKNKIKTILEGYSILTVFVIERNSNKYVRWKF